VFLKLKITLDDNLENILSVVKLLLVLQALYFAKETVQYAYMYNSGLNQTQMSGLKRI